MPEGMDDNDDGEVKKKRSQGGFGSGDEGMDGEGDEEGEEDENLDIDMDEVVDILRDFHKKREERANNAELLGNPRMKKRSNFETEEQKKERVKREERIFWEKMTTVLND